MDESIDVAVIGLREQNKQEKLERIKKAAREVFLEKGFEGATTKEIAERSRVGTGTLFNYASDKLDLLFLITVEEVALMVNQAFSDVPRELPLLEQLIVVFRNNYQYYHQYRELGLRMLKEMPFYFYLDRDTAKQFKAHSENFVNKLGGLVENAVEDGKIKPDCDVELVRDLIFTVFSREIRIWLSSPSPEIEQGLFRLRQYFKLLIIGLGPEEGAY